MNDAGSWSLAVGVLAGAALGGAFFGGLWWTVHRGLSSTVPGLWFVTSLLVRTLGMLCGIYALGRGDWRRVPACLLGFWIARSIITRLRHGPLAVSP